MKKPLLIGLVAVLVGIFAAIQFAGKGGKSEDWPKGQKLTIILPFQAGGSVDTMARQLAKYWEPELGATIVVDNRPGASGLVGTELFLKQPDDGSVMMLTTQLYFSAGAVLQGGKFSMDDFEVINFQQFDPSAITVLDDSPYKTFDDLVKAIKARPGEISAGFIVGGAPHLALAMLRERLDLDFKDITYSSGNAYRTALLGGHVDFAGSNVNGDRALKGKAKVLAVAAKNRSAIWPDAPTFNEALGVADFPELGSGRCIVVHKNFRAKHPERYKKLVETYKKAFDNPDYVKFRKDTGEDEVSANLGPEESNKLNRDLHNVLTRYKDRILAVQKK